MRRASGLATLALLVAGGVVHASAPADQYDFFKADTPEIKDDFTKLTWERWPDQTQTRDFAGAVAYCVSKTGAGWRLPTVKELLTIVDEETNGTFEGGEIVYRAIDRNAFPNTVRADYWSASHDPSDPEAWVVNFETGASKSLGETQPAYVRCVKNTQ
jgi:Protein of unknown function (DUF1566)